MLKGSGLRFVHQDGVDAMSRAIGVCLAQSPLLTMSSLSLLGLVLLPWVHLFTTPKHVPYAFSVPPSVNVDLVNP